LSSPEKILALKPISLDIYEVLINGVQDIRLGKRNNTRAAEIVYSISKLPKSSIPKSCQGGVETQATYRFYFGKMSIGYT
jgi:hypothetical protein